MRILLRVLLIIVFLIPVSLLGLRYAAHLRESLEADDLAPTIGTFIATASGRFFIQRAGPPEATPLLLAYGTAAWSGFWRQAIDRLAQDGHHAIAFDLPPFGLSDRARGADHSRPAQATRILDLVDTLDARPIPVAHSFGAAAATEAVLRDPDAFSGLIIVDGALGMTEAPSPKAMPRLLHPHWLREVALSSTATNPFLTRTLLRGLLHDKETATAAQAAILQLPQRRSETTAAYADWLPSLLAPKPDSLSRLASNYAKFPVPVRLLWGDRDTITPPAQAEALARAIGQKQVIYIEDVGHIPHIEAPLAFNAALIAAVNDILSNP